MTGEITLRGKVLPVGGIKRKNIGSQALEDQRNYLVRKQPKDVAEIKEDYFKGLTFHFVKEMHEVLDLAITDQGEACESIVVYVYCNLCPHPRRFCVYLERDEGPKTLSQPYSRRRKGSQHGLFSTR